MSPVPGTSGMSRPSHRTQRLLIAGAVLLAAALFVVATRWFAPRPTSVLPRERLVEPAAQTASLQLYFAAPDSNGLLAEPRAVALPEHTGERARAVLLQLLSGPTAGGVAALAPGTSVRAVYVVGDGDELCLDFFRPLRPAMRGSTGEYLALASVVRSLHEAVPRLRRVTLLEEGKPMETLAGHFDLSAPLAVEDFR